MLSNRIKDLMVSSSAIRAMFEEGKRLAVIHGEENVFDYSLGNPYAEPPETVKNTIIDILSEESPNLVHGYMNNSGYPDVRAKIADFTNKKYTLNLNENNIIMTCGAAGGLNIIFKTLLNPGDEIITFAPYFGEYKNYVNNYDGRLVIASSNLDNFQPDLNDLESKITSKTKGILINSPNNPTGAVYSAENIKALAEVLTKKQKEFNTSIYLMADEPYKEIIYDGVEVPNILNYYNNSLVCYSYSKSLSLPGERIGYIIANNGLDYLDELMKGLNVANRVLGFVNAPSLFQRVVSRILDSEVDVNIYKRNRDLLYNHLTKIGFSCVKPNGSFYLFPKSLIEDDVKFCEDAKKFNLLIVPGTAFGCPGHFRIAYCISYDKIEKSLSAFDKLAELYLG